MLMVLGVNLASHTVHDFSKSTGLTSSLACITHSIVLKIKTKKIPVASCFSYPNGFILHIQKYFLLLDMI